ncbi:MAG: SusC/RagA family TonB-linked outer membrane protein [Bernardetiaceae bacterium]|nr:SusC/RagA family TonB-linked outer membrane protein [Bernardetiaceae bacterium]
MRTLMLRYLLWVCLLMAGSGPIAAQSLAWNGQPQNKLTLREALRQLEKQHRAKFIYETELLDQKIADPGVVKSQQPLEQKLDQLLQPIGLGYKPADGGYYFIFPQKVKQTPKEPKATQETPADPNLGSPVATDPAGTTSLGQEPTRLLTDRTLSGRVTDDTRAGLPGVSILLKGTVRGTTTDVDGRFKLSIPDAGGTLVFSYVGYQTQEVAVTTQSDLNVTLASDIKSLQEVVVVGYGEQKRSDLTGSIASVKSEDIKNLPVRSVTDALQGRVAGVYVTSESGQPGANSNITIRGAGSLGGVSPLYVVDGMPFFGTGFNFNVQDIASIEVIKDASAAAIYGTQASGGVILITTKKGQSGELRVGFNANYGVRNVFNLPEQLGRDEYIRAQIANGRPASAFPNPSALPDTRWLDEIYTQGKEQNYTAYVSGGTAKSSFYLSTNYQRQDGVRINNWLERYTLRLNSEHNLSKRLKIGQTLYGTFTQDAPPIIPNQGPVNFRNSPLVPVYDPTNPLGGWGRDQESQRGNAVGDAYSTYRLNGAYAANLSAYLDWEIIDGLKFRTNLGANIDHFNSYYYEYAFDFGQVQRPQAQTTFGKDFGTARQLLANYTLSYTKKVGDHDFNGLVGYEARRAENSNIGGRSYFALLDRQTNFNLIQNDNLNRPFAGGDNSFRLLSQFARVNYAFKDKYLLQFNIRRDGVSNIFGPNNRFGVFPSVSAGWKITEEAFMKNLEVVSNAKLRVSYGRLGNYQGIGSFLFVGDFRQGFAADLGGGKAGGFGLSNKLPNADIRWESLLTTNVGLDLGFFGNRLTASIDWYNRQTKDMLYAVPLPPSAGLGNEVQYNIGEMRNTGLELALQYEGKTGDFTYSVGVNGAFNRNELISLDPNSTTGQIIDGGLNEVYGNQQPSRSVPGQPLGQFWGYLVDGVYQTADAARNGPTLSFANNERPAAGDLIYRDLNGDGTINDNDKTFIGNPWPRLTYGITLNGGWKGLDLRLFFIGVQGVDVYNPMSAFEHFFFNDYNSTARIFETSGFGGGPITDVPRANIANWGQVSSYHVENGSFLRLKNLQIGYTLPASVISKLKMTSARVFVMTDNLLTFTRYTGIDPETATAGSPRSRGIDNANQRYPLSRLYSLGLNIEF